MTYKSGVQGHHDALGGAELDEVFSRFVVWGVFFYSSTFFGHRKIIWVRFWRWQYIPFPISFHSTGSNSTIRDGIIYFSPNNFLLSNSWSYLSYRDVRCRHESGLTISATASALAPMYFFMWGSRRSRGKIKLYGNFIIFWLYLSWSTILNANSNKRISSGESVGVRVPMTKVYTIGIRLKHTGFMPVSFR